MEKECENSLIKSKITNISGLRQWTQSTIRDYFKFCTWEKQVLPTMDIENGGIELKGSMAEVSIHYVDEPTQISI
jgi:hypothetical protein